MNIIYAFISMILFSILDNFRAKKKQCQVNVVLCKIV